MDHLMSLKVNSCAQLPSRAIHLAPKYTEMSSYHRKVAIFKHHYKQLHNNTLIGARWPIRTLNSVETSSCWKWIKCRMAIEQSHPKEAILNWPDISS